MYVYVYVCLEHRFGVSIHLIVLASASGHVDRFTDLMVKDLVTQECMRADKYLEEILEKEIEKIKAADVPEDVKENQVDELSRISRQSDAYTADELQSLFIRFNVKSPSGNELSPPFPFHLMFGLKIGPKEETPACTPPPGSLNSDSNSSSSSSSGSGGSGKKQKQQQQAQQQQQQQQQQAQQQQQQQQEGRGYLRPETAQGIFVNFRRLYEFVGGRMPFAAAQIGLGFRNEIAPRNGLLRVREFQMAEIEHFCHPEKKDEFPKFKDVENKVLPLFSREQQLGTGTILKDVSLKEAVERKIIANKTLAYFLGRTFLFLTKVGIREEHIRFRQHLQTEMAHYAVDCWDAEVETSYGWIEVAGHADRSGNRSPDTNYILSPSSSPLSLSLSLSPRLCVPLFLSLYLSVSSLSLSLCICLSPLCLSLCICLSPVCLFVSLCVYLSLSVSFSVSVCCLPPLPLSVLVYVVCLSVSLPLSLPGVSFECLLGVFSPLQPMI